MRKRRNIIGGEQEKEREGKEEAEARSKCLT